MSEKRRTFQPVAPDVWRQLSEQLGADFVDRQGWRQDKIIAHHDGWTVTLDVHSEPRYRHEMLYTRFRAAYRNPRGLRFNIYHQGIWSTIAAALGGQDVKTGDAELDKRFIVKANDEQAIRRLLADERLRRMLLRDDDVHLHVRDSGDWFAQQFPEGIDELVLEVEGRVEDLPRLRRLYELLAHMLHLLDEHA